MQRELRKQQAAHLFIIISLNKKVILIHDVRRKTEKVHVKIIGSTDTLVLQFHLNH